MELYAILLSGPAGFFATLIYGVLLGRAVKSWPQIRVWLRNGSITVLCGLAIELLLLSALGATASRRLLDPGFFFVHSIIFFLGIPSLANLLVLQKRVPFVAHPIVAAIPCAFFACVLALMQYGVSEAVGERIGR